MKVALVHDYLNEFGGAERVLLALTEIYPNAPIYTAFYREGSSAYERFKGKKIITSWAQKVPFFASFLHSPLRFLAPLIWGSFHLSEYDVVLTSASWYVTKGMAKRSALGSDSNKEKGQTLGRPIEICYCHTPPRYLYGYPTAVNFQKYWPIKIYAAVVNHFMRVYDYEAAQRVNWFVANSKEIQARIKKFYRRDSVVIYPPVDVKKFTTKKTVNREQSTKYFLAVSRLVASKNVDIAIKACKSLGLNLKIVGSGGQEEYLKKLANVTPFSTDRQKKVKGQIEFLGQVDDRELSDLYRSCRALIFPASQEDFGIVPVEAMAAGKPVIALNEGGVKETVVDGKTGLLVDDLSVASFEKAIKRFIEMEKKGKWDSEVIRNHAQKFSKERFKKEIRDFIKSKVK